MKRRHLRAGIAVCAAAAAAIGMLLWSETDSQVAPAAATTLPGISDGWVNRNMDSSAFASVRADGPRQHLPADKCHTGSRSGIAPGQQTSPEPPRRATNAEFGIGGRVDGWANPDVDIGESR
jgi:hypothetical protein